MTPINFLACNISYLKVEQFEVPKNLLDQVVDFLDSNGIYYDEINQDLALRNETPAHMVNVMRTLFAERFTCQYLNHIYTNSCFDKEDVLFYPKYIFLKTERTDFLEMELNGNPLFIGDLHTMHQEISALANALGIILGERDNYPGGKQKVAFNLIDISWSAINSSMPLIVF